jgi:hypothetical protein
VVGEGISRARVVGVELKTFDACWVQSDRGYWTLEYVDYPAILGRDIQ